MVDVAGVVLKSDPRTLPLPKVVMGIFYGVNRVHRMWRGYRLFKSNLNPDNFAGLIAGCGANLLWNDSKFFRVSALLIQVAARVAAVAVQINNLIESVQKLKSTWKEQYPVSYKKHPNKLQKQINRINLLIYRTFFVLKDIFILSMRVMDAIEMFYMDPSTIKEGRYQIGVNATELFKDASQVAKLKQDIKENEATIKGVVDNMHTKVTGDEFIATADTALNIASVPLVVEDLSSTLVGRGLLVIVKCCATAGADMLGVYNNLPKWLQISKTENLMYSHSRPRHLEVYVIRSG